MSRDNAEMGSQEGGVFTKDTVATGRKDGLMAQTQRELGLRLLPLHSVGHRPASFHWSTYPDRERLPRVRFSGICPKSVTQLPRRRSTVPVPVMKEEQ